MQTEVFTTLREGTMRDALEPQRTALVVVDVQNDFGHRDGVMGRTGVDLSTVDPTVDRVQRLIDAAHGAGTPVFLVRLQTHASRDSPMNNLRRARTGRPTGEQMRPCREGQWGAAYYRIAPQPGDIEVTKWRYSSFGGTGLDIQLRARRIDTLVVCGLTSECCVETTVRDAYQLDYHVFVPHDATTGYDPTLHAMSLRSMATNFGIIVDTDSVVRAWKADADATP